MAEIFKAHQRVMHPLPSLFYINTLRVIILLSPLVTTP
jgi:hypothetical protein